MIVLEERSKITDKNQTTVPKRVRERLGVGPGDEIVYRVSDDGSILVESAVQADDEAAVPGIVGDEVDAAGQTAGRTRDLLHHRGREYVGAAVAGRAHPEHQVFGRQIKIISGDLLPANRYDGSNLVFCI